MILNFAFKAKRLRSISTPAYGILCNKVNCLSNRKGRYINEMTTIFLIFLNASVFLLPAAANLTEIAINFSES